MLPSSHDYFPWQVALIKTKWGKADSAQGNNGGLVGIFCLSETVLFRIRVLKMSSYSKMEQNRSFQSILKFKWIWNQFKADLYLFCTGGNTIIFP